MWLAQTFAQSVRFDGSLGREVRWYRIICQASLCLWVMALAVFLALSGLKWLVLLVSLLGTLMVMWGVPIAVFLLRFGFRWQDDLAEIERYMAWWDRLKYIDRPLLSGPAGFKYSPERDAYEVMFLFPREHLLRLLKLSDKYGDDLAHVVDLGLGLVEMHEACAEQNINAVMKVSSSERFTHRNRK